MPSNLWIKTGIPEGSRLEFAVRGRTKQDEPKFTARAKITRKDHSEDEWPQQQFRPGPHVVGPIPPNASWVVRVKVLFAEAAQAQILALIRKPDGSIFGGGYRYRFSGEAGDVISATLALRSNAAEAMTPVTISTFWE